MNRQRGMTMVELMVSLAVVLLIIGAATTAYLKLLRSYRTQGRLAESYMANLTGLEMLRYDIEMAGFGLPATLAAGATYLEAAAKGANNPQPPYDPSTLNDAASVPLGPRAFVQLDNGGANNSDVLAIKSSAANLNPTSKKWSMISRAGSVTPPYVKMWGGGAKLDPVMDFAAVPPADMFIILDNAYQLKADTSNNWCFPFTGAAGTPPTGYYLDASVGLQATVLPPSNTAVYYIYGLDNSPGAHRMPFNRVDYYLDNNSNFPKPSSCAGGTYTLYRSTISQADGTLITTPLIDCVMDFQVAFGLATNLDNNINSWVKNLGTMKASDIQQQLREVRVFLVYQEGLGDQGNSPSFRFSGVLNLGDQDIANGIDPADYPAVPNNFQPWSSAALPGALSNPTPAGVQLQYRWKVIEMAVKPMNLIRTQTP